MLAVDTESLASISYIQFNYPTAIISQVFSLTNQLFYFLLSASPQGYNCGRETLGLSFALQVSTGHRTELMGPVASPSACLWGEDCAESTAHCWERP